MDFGMKIRLVLPITTCLLLAASAALAGSGYDACRQEENRLRADEADLCTGMGYLFNPSACINARKALSPFVKGKCRDIAASEGVEEQRVEPARSSPATPTPQTVRSLPDTPGLTGQPHPAQVAPAEASARQSELELLRREVDELKVELQRQQQEIERLRGAK